MKPNDAVTALACLDLTSLNDSDTAADISTLCSKATAHGAVAAVCVWPRFVAQARAALPPQVKVAAVANFPAGALNAVAAVADAQAIAAAGGDEVDLVLPWRALQAGQGAAAAQVVQAVRQACAGLTLKLIIESGELQDPALIRAACAMGLDNGVDFLKTSTGKTPVGATPAAAQIMLQAIAAHPRGAAVGFKAAGGVRTVADAAVYIALVQAHLGTAAVNPRRLRFGASGLLADIVQVLGGTAAGGAAAATPPNSY
jgi:deoxyribose-phosphate aldolase